MKRRIKFLHGGLLLPVILILMTFYQAYAQENVTITTYYPSPMGSYRDLRSQRMAIGNNYSNPAQFCWGAGCGANVIPDAASLLVEGRVGIGVIAPQAALDVNGGVRIGNDGGACSSARQGTVRYRANQLEYCDGANWISTSLGMQITTYVDPSGNIGTHTACFLQSFHETQLGFSWCKVTGSPGNVWSVDRRKVNCTVMCFN